MEEVYEKAEPPYSGLTDDEEACACTRSRWCGGRAFADEHRLAGVPTGRAATLVFSLVCIASAIDCVASLCTTGMRLVAGAALAVCAAYNLWATWTPTPLPFPPTWAWHKRASRAHGVESGCAGAAAAGEEMGGLVAGGLTVTVTPPEVGYYKLCLSPKSTPVQPPPLQPSQRALQLT